MTPSKNNNPKIYVKQHFFPYFGGEKLYLFRLQICSLYLDHLRLPQKLFLFALKGIHKLSFFKSKMVETYVKLETSKKVPHIAPEKISKEPKQIPQDILPTKKTNQNYVKTKIHYTSKNAFYSELISTEQAEIFFLALIVKVLTGLELTEEKENKKKDLAIATTTTPS